MAKELSFFTTDFRRVFEFLSMSISGKHCKILSLPLRLMIFLHIDLKSFNSYCSRPLSISVLAHPR